jgi:1,2-phenylacetyl-CoA epoxidase catalytic subunit
MLNPIPKVLHSKSVNAIPSSCKYKLSQNSNDEIRDSFIMRVLHKIMPLGFNGTFTNIWTTIARPSCTSNTSNQFFV